MKKFLSILFATMLAGQAWAAVYDFSAVCSSGQKLYYIITSNTSVMVTYPNRNSYYDPYGEKPSGDLIIPDTVTYDGKKYAVTEINGCAFYNCVKLTSVIVPNSVIRIEDQAFWGCRSLKSMTLPFAGNKRYKSWETKAPFGCIFGTDSYDGGIGIEQYRYSGGEIKRVYYIPSTLKFVRITNCENIQYGAFINCSSIISITLPESVTSIEEKAFGNCSSLVSINIPNSLTNIGANAFVGCENIKYNEYDNACYIGNNGNPYLCLIKVKNPNITSCEINNSCKFICQSAFSNCSDLISLSIPNSVENIGDKAFNGCVGLSAIVIPKSVKSIGQSVFAASTTLYCECAELEGGYNWHFSSVSYNKRVYNCRPIKIESCNIELGNIVTNIVGGVGENDSLWFTSGAIVELSAISKNGHFVKWSDGNTDNPRTITIARGLTYLAEFEEHSVIVDAAVAPTCTKTGLSEGKHCSVCNAVIVEQTEIPMVEHTIVTDAAVAATATETGLTEGSHCSVCGAVIVAQEVIPALGEQGGENTNPGTAVAELAADNLQVYAHHNTIIVENATDEIRVYNAMGALVGRDVACRVRAELQVNGAGVYIVKVGTVAKRVMIND